MFGRFGGGRGGTGSVRTHGVCVWGGIWRRPSSQRDDCLRNETTSERCIESTWESKDLVSGVEWVVVLEERAFAVPYT